MKSRKRRRFLPLLVGACMLLLAGCGEDDTIHYDVKIKAAGLLLDNIGNTFVTPVFNGSASLRDAAGAMIENTVKSVRRGQQVDDGYIENLYSDMTSLYRLDQISRQNSMNSGQADLGRLPGTAVLLLACGLLLRWLHIRGAERFMELL